MPCGVRSNRLTPSMSSSSFRRRDAAGWVMPSESAARRTLPSSSIAASNSNWRVLSRARTNQFE